MAKERNMMSSGTSTSPKYQNLTISGLPGSGSTTLLNSLKEALKFEGWKGFSGGEFMRAYAAEQGLFDNSNKVHHDATVYGDDFDLRVDMGMREKLATQDHWIIESWLSGFLAQGVPRVLKVLMICSDDSIRIDRIVNRDLIDVAHAKEHIHGRKLKNEQKWRRMYEKQWQEWVVKPGTMEATAPIDFWDPALYDLVLDTYSTNRIDSLAKVMHALQQT